MPKICQTINEAEIITALYLLYFGWVGARVHAEEHAVLRLENISEASQEKGRLGRRKVA